MTEEEKVVNRSEAIRNLLQIYGATASPTRIVKELAEKGVVVTPNLVSNLKNEMFRQKKSSEKKEPAAATDRDLIIKTKRLVTEAGSINKVRDYLALLEELEDN